MEPSDLLSILFWIALSVTVLLIASKGFYKRRG